MGVKKSMYFMFFNIGDKTEKDILKAGFQVNSYDEQNVYNGSKIEFTYFTPKDYIFQGYIWKPIESSQLSERSYCLARTPLMPFDELWDTFLQTKDENDRLGSMIVMYKAHYALLLKKYNELLGIENKSKNEMRALKSLAKII